MLQMLPYLAGQLLFAVPMLLGLVLIAVRARGTARVLGMIGCLIMLLGHILGSVWSMALPWAANQFDLPTSALGIPSAIIGLVSAVGLVLVICAVVAGRSTSTAPAGGPRADQYGQPGQSPNQGGQPPNYGQRPVPPA